MAVVEFRFDVKPISYVTSNPTLVLSDGEPIFLEDGSYAFGDGSTQLSALTFFSPGSATTRLLSGGSITIGTYGGSGTNNDVRIAAASWFISGNGVYSTSVNSDFNDIALSASGQQRYVGFFGNASSAIVKVEGTEGTIASYPDTPANTCPIGYVLVTDGAVGSGEEPSTVNFADIGGNASDNASLAAYVKNPRVTSVASSATPTPDIDTTDQYNITALAVGATFGAPTGTVAPGKKLIIRIKDNGTARALSFNAIYRASSDLALPTTTTVSKTMYLGFVYNSTDTKWDLIAKLDNF